MTNGKKHWAQNEWGCKRQKDLGEINCENKVKYPLPDIGDFVYVRVNHVYFKRQGAEKNIKCKYELDDGYVDAWGAPVVFKVVGYSLSKDEPLAKGNYILLEGKRNGSSYIYKKSIDTIRVSIGYYFLEQRPDDKQIYRSVKGNADNSPVSEYTSLARKKMREAFMDEEETD